MAKDPYTQGLKAEYGSMMTGFPDLKLADITAIVTYINGVVADANKPKGPEDTGPAAKDSSNQNAIIFGVISLILAIIALILMQVNSNLKKMSDDVEGIQRPDPVPFYRNKIYIAMVAVVFFVVGGYMLPKALSVCKDKQTTSRFSLFIIHIKYMPVSTRSTACIAMAMPGKANLLPFLR